MTVCLSLVSTLHRSTKKTAAVRQSVSRRRTQKTEMSGSCVSDFPKTAGFGSANLKRQFLSVKRGAYFPPPLAVRGRVKSGRSRRTFCWREKAVARRCAVPATDHACCMVLPELAKLRCSCPPTRERPSAQPWLRFAQGRATPSRPLARSTCTGIWTQNRPCLVL